MNYRKLLAPFRRMIALRLAYGRAIVVATGATLALLSVSPSPALADAPLDADIALSAPDPSVMERTLRIELDELDVRIRRARIGVAFGTITSWLGLGAMITTGIAVNFCLDDSPCPTEHTPRSIAALSVGATFAIGGLVIAVIFGNLLSRKKKRRKEVRERLHANEYTKRWPTLVAPPARTAIVRF